MLEVDVVARISGSGRAYGDWKAQIRTYYYFWSKIIWNYTMEEDLDKLGHEQHRIKKSNFEKSKLETNDLQIRRGGLRRRILLKASSKARSFRRIGLESNIDKIFCAKEKATINLS